MEKNINLSVDGIIRVTKVLTALAELKKYTSELTVEDTEFLARFADYYEQNPNPLKRPFVR